MNDSERLLNVIIKGIKEKKGQNIVCLDLRKIENSICEYFIISHADSNKHVQAISEFIEEIVDKEMHQKFWHREGFENAQWVLIDYIDVVVHIFQKEYREYYDIENIWGDAEKIQIS